MFSPGSEALSQIQTDSTARTPRTAGRSRLSELGSLDTAAASGRDEPAIHSIQEDDETEDLDSLDDGLHAFTEPAEYNERRPTIDQSGETVLPSHDGLGTFPGNSLPVQEQFWQHERYNPKRRRQSLRRSSLQRKFETLAEEDLQRDVANERLERIENWRMEQSRAILEEIERETRRRRRKEAPRTDTSRNTATTNPISVPPSTLTATSIHPDAAPPASPPERTESFWARFTRRVIHNLMGIDDATLSVIFGEALATDESRSTAAQIIADAEAAMRDDETPETGAGSSNSPWGERFLERIGRELGVLVHQLREHPGAFSTYLRNIEAPPYAGLPHPRLAPATPRHHERTHAHARPSADAHSIHFTPTLHAHAPSHPQTHGHGSTATDPSLWGIDEADESAAAAAAATPKHTHLHPFSPAHTHASTHPQPTHPTIPSPARPQPQDQTYWERDLDAKLLLGYLRNRLSTSPPSPSPTTGPHNPSQQLHPSSPSRRAALIRHHHPLVSQQQQQRRAPAAPTAPPAQQQSPAPARGTNTSSCASQSARRSRTSSRNYWDLGARSSVSVGSVSVAGGGGGGGWGEV